mmetsp:Transcript_79493/g.233668  ORF Transcript_79493/g.233668 Transcript_79493/m.233668 type:complete len:81 (-) Transcript_79493:118-360(-)
MQNMLVPTDDLGKAGDLVTLLRWMVTCPSCCFVDHTESLHWHYVQISGPDASELQVGSDTVAPHAPLYRCRQLGGAGHPN